MSVLITIPEKQTLIVTAAFYDESGAAQTPTSATYRIHNKKNGRIIKAITALSGLSTTKAIEVTGAENALVGTGDQDEEHVLTLEYAYGSGRTGKAQVSWIVQAYPGVA